MIYQLSAKGGVQKSSGRSARVVYYLVCLLLGTAITFNSAVAQDDVYFSIPKASADVALKQFAQQSQRQVLYPSELVSEFESNSLEGYFSSDEALIELFRGTGLHVFVDDNNNLIVRVATEEELRMSKPTKVGLGIASALATMFAANGAQAQEPGFAIEEISVTARKVRENMQDVPISVSAFSADTLERRQISSTDDISKITPNLEFTAQAPLAGNNNSSMVFIRGIGQISAGANVDPGVGLYIDDVYMGQSVGGTMEMRDISSVQVLRGPQGSLFGRNTIGGAVLLTTTEPGSEQAAELKITGGQDGLVEAFGAVDLPVSDTWRTRFTLGSKQQDGYVTRLFDGQDLGDTSNWTITGKSVWEIGDNTTVKLNADYTRADENGNPLVFAAYGNNTSAQAIENFAAGMGPPQVPAHFGANRSALAGCPDAFYLPGGPTNTVAFGGDYGSRSVPGALSSTGQDVPVAPGPPQGYTGENNDPRCANNQWNRGAFANEGTGPLGSQLKNWGASLVLETALNDEWTFKSVTSYRDLEWQGLRDADNMPFTILHTDYDSAGDQFSQEFQFLYSSDRLTGVTGLYYYNEEVVDVLTVGLGNRDSLDSDNNTVRNSNWAIFSEWTYDISDALSGTFGLRYTDETKESLPDQFDYANPDAKYLPAQWYSADFSATTVSATLNYRWTDTLMTYARYAEGFKGGGWNSSFNVPQVQSVLGVVHQFDQEEAETWEIGFKADFSNSLRLNGAIFATDYTDLQFIYRVGPAPYLLNAGKATIDGAELELTWLPTDNWIIEASIGILDDGIDQIEDYSAAIPGLSASVQAGNTLPYTPDFTASLGIGYTFLAGNYTFSPRIDFSHKDETYFDAGNTSVIAQLDTVTITDLSIAIESAASWRVIVGINNATDKEYQIAGNSSLTTGSGYAEVAYARPRYAFITLDMDF